MIKEGLRHYKGKRILLLQGPFGPFFQRLGRDFERAGAEVLKVNFHGGDWLFYPTDAVNFRGKLSEWPAFLERLLVDREIDVVFLFGDCRPIHSEVREIAHEWGVGVGVFEEGYVRPDYITLERYGVNGHSRLPKSPEFYLRQPEIHVEQPMSVGNSLWYAVLFSILYYAASILLRPVFPNYRHHRELSVKEGFLWLGSSWRKQFYAKKEKGIQKRLETSLSGKYFLLPLQVHNDAQILVHSKFTSIEDFIHHVIQSFGAFAEDGIYLVIKHHPLDRAYNDYSDLIDHAVEAYGLQRDRIIYIHDQHLPTLIRNSKGVVALNSTVGMSVLHHAVPLKICGKAVYDIEGLTFGGSLDEFWTKACPGDFELFEKFRSYLIKHNQLNGNFYKRLPIPKSHSGIRWFSGQKPRRIRKASSIT